MRLGLGPVIPVEARHDHRTQEAQRHPYIGVIVAAARFQQQDIAVPVLRKARGHHAARAAAAHDDIIELRLFPSNIHARQPHPVWRIC